MLTEQRTPALRVDDKIRQLDEDLRSLNRQITKLEVRIRGVLEQLDRTGLSFLNTFQPFEEKDKWD